MKRQNWQLFLTITIAILLVIGLSYWAFWTAMRAETNLRYSGLQTAIATHLENTIKGMEMSAVNVFNAVEKNLDSPDAVIAALQSEAPLNPNVLGYFAAFEPYYFKSEGHWFEPYVHHIGNDPYQTTLVGCDTHDYIKSPWYVSAKKTKQTFWSDPYYYYDGTDISGHYTTFVKPIYDKNDQLVCVCGADVTFEWLGKELERINESCRQAPQVNKYMMGRNLDFYSVVMNKEGVCILHPSEKYVPIDDVCVLDDVKNGQTGMTQMKIEGESCTLYYGPIKSLEWSVFLVIPTFDVQKPFLYVGVALALLAAIAILVAYVICRRFRLQT